MNSNLSRKTRSILFNSVSAIFLCVLFAYLCWALRPLILPIVLGILLAFLFRPLKTAFKAHWLPESIRITLLLGFLVVGLFVSIQFLRSNIPNEKENLEIQVRLKYKLNQKYNEIMGFDAVTGKGNSIYNLIGADINPMMKTVNDILNLSEDQKNSFLHYVHGANGLAPVPDIYYQYYLSNEKSTAQEVEANALAKKDAVVKVNSEKDHSLVMDLMDVISIWLILPFVFVFFLIDEDSITQFFIRMVPNKYFELSLTMKEKVDEAIGGYLRGICLECLLVGISLAIGFYLMGIPLNVSLLIAALSGLATAIPFFGPIVGVGFGLVYVLIAEQLNPLLPFINSGNSPLAVIIVNLIVLGLDNLVFQPIVLGGAVDLHPLVIVIGLTAGSMLFGLAGVLLAIPAIVIAKVMISSAVKGLKAYRII